MEKVNLREKFARFTGHWSPKVVGELNGQQVKLVKLRGEFVWHKHDGEDELFLVVQGRFPPAGRTRLAPEALVAGCLRPYRLAARLPAGPRGGAPSQDPRTKKEENSRNRW
jgi:hypothetical protein